MSFGAEIKDFISGFGTGRALQHQAKQDAYMQRQMDDDFDDAKVKGDLDVRDGVKKKPFNLGDWLGETLGFDGKPTPKSPVGSPVGAAQTSQALPLAVYQNANTGAVPAPPMYGDSIYDEETKGYADGGIVDDEYEQGAPQMAVPAPAPQPPQQALPMPQSAPAAPAPQAAVMAPPQEEKRSGLSAALHDGLMMIQNEFGLGQRNTAVGPDPNQQRGQQAMYSGAGRVSDEDYAAAAKRVDPKGELGDAQRNLEVMKKGYDFYLLKGEPEKASKYAASIIQYATTKAAEYGTDALSLLKKGDLQGAADNLVTAYNTIPNGQHVEAQKVSSNGTVNVKQVNTETGETIEEHTLTGQQLYQAAIGLANKSASWQAIMEAATMPQGIPDRPLSDAYNDAMLELGGANPDGTPKSAPAAGGVGASSAAPTPSAAPAPAPTGNGALISRADPNAMHLVESNNNPNAVSPKGASGIAQTMPATLMNPGYGVRPAQLNGDPKHDAAEKQRVGDEYLQALDTHYGNPVLAHVAYNWGPGNMEKWKASGGSFAKLPPETQQYLGRIAVAQSQGAQPLKSITDGSGGGSAPAPKSAPTRMPLKAAANAAREKLAVHDAQRPNSVLDIQDILPEDVKEQPELVMPEEPGDPVVHRINPEYLKGMHPKERQDYVKAIAKTNLDNKKEFQNLMSKYRTDATAAQTAYRAAVAAAKPGADPMKLPVKDRTDALAAMAAARPDPADKTSAMALMQPETQKTIDGLAYDIYVHNDTTPSRAYELALSMMKNPTSDRLSFSPHRMPGDNTVRLVFGDKEKYVIPMNTYGQFKAARGNERYIAHLGDAETATRAAEAARIRAAAGKAVDDFLAPPTGRYNARVGGAQRAAAERALLAKGAPPPDPAQRTVKARMAIEAARRTAEKNAKNTYPSRR